MPPASCAPKVLLLSASLLSDQTLDVLRRLRQLPIPLAITVSHVSNHPLYVFSSGDAVRARFARLLDAEPSGLESVLLLVAADAPPAEYLWASAVGIRVIHASRGLGELDQLVFSPPAPC